MNGKIVGVAIVAIAIAFGVAVYWSQIYAYYTPVPASSEAAQIRLVSVVTGEPEPIEVTGFDGIDADSSPLRFRACFTVQNSLAMLTETYQLAEGAVPLNGPGWFSCYSAREIGEAIARDEALVFLSEPNVKPGFRRVVAVFDDGRAFAWHEADPSHSE